MTTHGESAKPEAGGDRAASSPSQEGCVHDFRREPYDFTKDGYFADDYDSSRQWVTLICTKCGYSRVAQEPR